MKQNQNDCFGSDALIISCCFPARRWWESRTTRS